MFQTLLKVLLVVLSFEYIFYDELYFLAEGAEPTSQTHDHVRVSRRYSAGAVCLLFKGLVLCGWVLCYYAVRGFGGERSLGRKRGAVILFFRKSGRELRI